MWSLRPTVAIVAGIVALAVAPSFAAGGNCAFELCFVAAEGQPNTGFTAPLIIDDYWRDSLHRAGMSAFTSPSSIDDYWRDQLKPAGGLKSLANPDRRNGRRGNHAAATLADPEIDAYWRDQPTTLAAGNRFDWNDFALGIGVGTGSLIALAGLAAGLFATRLSRTRTTSEIA